ncbi:2-dehydro-3-deoxygalactonokinase [Dyella sp. RRB7]|uniref:2-dehydro-3-deoxygalactonokinase n=1 Tax=Dyella sp. RRB7 TaxID=2919502 RepID=UPI001FAB08F1|nr:2-dehydro-3-deoxygalactonokinase [Dyella sp. RRB7]
MGGLIGLDWGTTSLRAYWLDEAGAIREVRARPWGVRQLPEGGFDAALADITRDWPALPRLASGMVGSRQGWLEVPYIDLPADLQMLARNVRRLHASDGGDVHVVPGLRNPQGPDVMRGEEIQLFGALARQPALAAHSTWILPGTHSKWASVCDGAVVDFSTLMTGELFALLRQHSILGIGTSDATLDEDAFVRGVIVARDSCAAGAFSRLFSARALVLDGALGNSAVPGYLSGLLIGEEFRCRLATERFSLGAPIQLIGDDALCARYRLAAAHFDIELAESVTDAAAHGLWQIAGQIGLIQAASIRTAKEIPSC